MENLISENKRLNEENDEIREASERNAVKFGMVARKNREYLDRIEQLEKELLGLRRVKSENVLDEDENELPFRHKRKRPRMDDLESSDEEKYQSKKIKTEAVDFAEPKKETRDTLLVIADWMQDREGPKGLKFYTKLIEIEHKCECWIVCHRTDTPGCTYILRNPREKHEDHCRAAVNGRLGIIKNCAKKLEKFSINNYCEVFREWENGSGWHSGVKMINEKSKSNEEMYQSKKIETEAIDFAETKKETRDTLLVVADWMQDREGPKGLKFYMKMMEIEHECECWIVCHRRDTPGCTYILRNPLERHEDHCRAAVNGRLGIIKNCAKKFEKFSINNYCEVFQEWEHGSGWHSGIKMTNEKSRSKARSIKQEVEPENEANETLLLTDDKPQSRDQPEQCTDVQVVESVVHESKCWTVCRVGDADGYVVRKPKESHKKHCTVVVTDQKCHVMSCGKKQYLARTGKKYKVFLSAEARFAELQRQQEVQRQQEFDELLAKVPAAKSLRQLPWKLQRLLHGHILRPCQSGERAMLQVFGKKFRFVAEPTELDFTVDLTAEEMSLVIFHRCECWLVFGVLVPSRSEVEKIYALRYAECRGELLCDIKTLRTSSHEVTNCNGAEAKFVCQYDFNLQRQQNRELIINHKMFLVENILRDPHMFKIPLKKGQLEKLARKRG